MATIAKSGRKSTDNARPAVGDVVIENRAVGDLDHVGENSAGVVAVERGCAVFLQLCDEYRIEVRSAEWRSTAHGGALFFG